MFLLVCQVQSQENKQLQFTPATEQYYASINSYSSETGDFEQYYVEDSKWVKNENIPSFAPIYDIKDQRIQYIPANEKFTPQLFVYSKRTGEFSFFYLDKNEWANNYNMPSGKTDLGLRNITMEYSKGSAEKSAYIFAYNSNGNKTQLLEVADGTWTEIDFFPSDFPK